MFRIVMCGHPRSIFAFIAITRKEASYESPLSDPHVIPRRRPESVRQSPVRRRLRPRKQTWISAVPG